MTSDHDQASRFATLTFRREVTVPVSTLWQAWISPAARAVWASPSPSVTVEFLEADLRIGGSEVSLCKVTGQPDVRCEARWLVLEPTLRSVNSEVISSDGVIQSAALITAQFNDLGGRSSVLVTVQLASLAEDMAAGYRQGFDAGLNNLVDVAERTMILQRVINAPRAAVWNVWMNAETLPQWWGPDGFSCRTQRIDLRSGGEWVFDMIASDGTVYPNHHKYGAIHPQERFNYALLWGENGPKHADAWASFDDVDGGTRVTLGMIFNTGAEFQNARGFGAEALGQQTLAKLGAFIAAQR